MVLHQPGDRQRHHFHPSPSFIAVYHRPSRVWEKHTSQGFAERDASFKRMCLFLCLRYRISDQTPWIQNTTIKKNIIGQELYDDVWFLDVVNACTLDHDIEELQRGIGETIFLIR